MQVAALLEWLVPNADAIASAFLADIEAVSTGTVGQCGRVVTDPRAAPVVAPFDLPSGLIPAARQIVEGVAYPWHD